MPGNALDGHVTFLTHTRGNLIIRNICIGQNINFSISANDTYGPVVTDMGARATSGADAHHWTNFSR